MRAVVAPGRPAPVARPLAGRGHRGRRPAHRAGVQRAAEGGRGTAAAHGLPALRAVDPSRRRVADDPLALPAGRAAHAAGRRRRRGARAATASTPTRAAWAAAAGQGHVGRARRLARDAEARERRADGAGDPAPADLAAGLPARPPTSWSAPPRPRRRRCPASSTPTRPRRCRSRSGAGGTGRAPRAPRAARRCACASWRERQKSRATRTQRDALDRALVDLAAFYRDVLLVQAGLAGRAAPTRTVADDVRAVAARIDPRRRAATARRGARLPRGARAERQAADRRRGDGCLATPALTSAWAPVEPERRGETTSTSPAGRAKACGARALTAAGNQCYDGG